MPDDPAWRRAFSKVRQRLAGMVPRDKPAPIGSSRLETLPNELKHEIIAAGLTGDPNEDSRYLSKVKRLNSHFSNFVAPEETTKGTKGKLPHFSPVAKYNRVLNEPGQLARDLYREVIPNDELPDPARLGPLHRFAREVSPAQRITTVGPILKFQPRKVRSDLAMDIRILGGDKRIEALNAIAPHYGDFDPESRTGLINKALTDFDPFRLKNTLPAIVAADKYLTPQQTATRARIIGSVVSLAAIEEGEMESWNNVVAVGRYLTPKHIAQLTPLMNQKPELRQRLDDAASSRAIGDPNSVSRQNQNDTTLGDLRRTFEIAQNIDTDNPLTKMETYGRVARIIAAKYDFAKQELMKSKREIPKNPRGDLMNSKREPSGHGL